MNKHKISQYYPNRYSLSLYSEDEECMTGNLDIAYCDNCTIKDISNPCKQIGFRYCAKITESFSFRSYFHRNKIDTITNYYSKL